MAGSPIGGIQGLYEVSHIIEKPTPTIAEQELIVPGLTSRQLSLLLWDPRSNRTRNGIS